MRNHLGFITPQITMSLGDGNINLGYITPKITAMLGQEATPPSPASSGTILFGAMLLGLGIATGFAIGVGHGVKISR